MERRKERKGKRKGKLLLKAFLKGRNFDERESFADMAGIDLFTLSTVRRIGQGVFFVANRRFSLLLLFLFCSFFVSLLHLWNFILVSLFSFTQLIFLTKNVT